MPAFTHHIFVCCNQRSPDHSRGCCDPDGSQGLRTALKAAVAQRGLKPAVRANSAALSIARIASRIAGGSVGSEPIHRVLQLTREEEAPRPRTGGQRPGVT